MDSVNRLFIFKVQILVVRMRAKLKLIEGSRKKVEALSQENTRKRTLFVYLMLIV